MFVVEMLLDHVAMKSFERNLKKFNKRKGGRFATVINRTARFAVNKAAEEVQKELNLKKKDITGHWRGKHDRQTGRRVKSNQQIYVSKKAKAKDPTAAIMIKKTPQIGLQYYGARHIKSGVSYKISRNGGRKTATRPHGAFMGPRAGVIAIKLYGGVFMRKAGAKRLPIRKMFGPSVWGAFTKHKMDRIIEKAIRSRLRHEIDRSIKKLKGKEWIDPDKRMKQRIRARKAAERAKNRKFDFLGSGGGF